MTKEFKVLKLTFSKDYNTGIESLLAILSEIEDFEITGLDFIPEMFNSKGTYFVLPKDSETVQYLINNPLERKSIDMSRYFEHTLNIDDTVEKAFFEIQMPKREDINIDGWV